MKDKKIIYIYINYKKTQNDDQAPLINNGDTIFFKKS